MERVGGWTGLEDGKGKVWRMEKKRVERLKGKGLEDGNERGRDWKRKRVGGWTGLEDGKGWIKERV